MSKAIPARYSNPMPLRSNSTLKANHKLGVIAEQAALFNSCVAVHLGENPNYVPDEVVSHCNGGVEPTAR